MKKLIILNAAIVAAVLTFFLVAVYSLTASAEKPWIHGSNIKNGIWIWPSSHPAPAAFTSHSRIPPGFKYEPQEQTAAPIHQISRESAEARQARQGGGGHSDLIYREPAAAPVHYRSRRSDRDYEYEQQFVCREALWHGSNIAWKYIREDCRSHWTGSPYKASGRRRICFDALWEFTTRRGKWIKRKCRWLESRGKL